MGFAVRGRHHLIKSVFICCCLLSLVLFHRLEIQSRCWNARLVVDGRWTFHFNHGARAHLQLLEEDALRTVVLEWNSLAYSSLFSFSLPLIFIMFICLPLSFLLYLSHFSLSFIPSFSFYLSLSVLSLTPVTLALFFPACLSSLSPSLSYLVPCLCFSLRLSFSLFFFPISFCFLLYSILQLDQTHSHSFICADSLSSII